MELVRRELCGDGGHLVVADFDAAGVGVGVGFGVHGGVDRLKMAGRLEATGASVSYVRFLEDLPALPLANN